MGHTKKTKMAKKTKTATPSTKAIAQLADQATVHANTFSTTLPIATAVPDSTTQNDMEQLINTKTTQKTGLYADDLVVTNDDSSSTLLRNVKAWMVRASFAPGVKLAATRH